MDLVDLMQEAPTAAELQVRKLQQQLDELEAHGKQWTESALIVSRRLEYARAQVRAEGES
jgi:hypothetical protein